MNAILRNVRILAVSFPKPLGYVNSSTSAEVAVIPETEEPDKLYKRIEIEMRSVDHEVMRSYGMFAKMTANHLGITVGKCWTPFKPFFDRENLTLLRSAFAKKKCRVQYEVRTYFRFMNVHHLTGSTADTFLEYIERNLPEGVSLKITKVECQKLPEETTSFPEPENTIDENKNEP